MSLILPIILIVVLVLFTMRNGRKRQKDQLALSDGLKPGAEIMTTFGVFGTIKSFDEAENKVVIVTGPGSELTIHRQALGKIVTPTAAAAADETPVERSTAVLNGEPIDVGPSSPPAFGERTAAGDDSGRPAARAAERPAD